MTSNVGKVIELANYNDDMGKRIEEAKRKIDLDREQKNRLADECKVDVRELFTDEELARMIEENDSFVGRVADLDKATKYENAVKAAEWLLANSIDVVNIESESVSADRPNAVVSVDIRRLAGLHGMPLKVLTYLWSTADSVFLSGIHEQTIRFTFGIEGIWKE